MIFTLSLVSIYNWELCALLKCGDILLLRDCFAKFHLGSIRLRLKNEYNLLKIGDFCLEFNEKPDISQNGVETPSESTSSSSRVKEQEVNKNDQQKDKCEIKKEIVNPYKPPAFRIPKFSAPHRAPEILTIDQQKHDKAAESYSKLRVCPNTAQKSSSAEIDHAKKLERLETLKLIFR